MYLWGKITIRGISEDNIRGWNVAENFHQRAFGFKSISVADVSLI